MVNSFLPFSLLALVSIANAAAVKQSPASEPEISANTPFEDLPFTPAQVPTWNWDEKTVASNLEARHDGKLF